MDLKAWLTSKTAWGIFIVVLGVLLDPAILGVLPPKIASIVQLVGGVLTTIGLRSAVAKVTPPVA